MEREVLWCDTAYNIYLESILSNEITQLEGQGNIERKQGAFVAID